MAAILKFSAWKVFPVEMQGHAWSVSGGIFSAILLAVIGMVFSSGSIWLVIALAAGFELQTVACGIWYLLDPWETKPGQALCSSGLQFPMGLVGLWFACCVLVSLRAKR